MAAFKSWKSFDFGPETSVDGPSPAQSSKPIKKTVRSKTVLKENNHSVQVSKALDFYELISPKNPEELIIHTKKLQEIEGWLKSVSNSSLAKTKTPLLLLTGPTGIGKTTTVKVLSKALGFEVTEWTNPVDCDYEVFKGPGQVTRFLEFFGEAKYCSLFGSGNNKKVLLVKDFPNALIKNPDEFVSVLEDIYFKATHPVVFICTDSNSNECNLQRLLFPEELLFKYAISHYSFNACAPTLLKKGLKRACDILQTYPNIYQSPSQNTIDAILASSQGDIRCALNQLYLASVSGTTQLSLQGTTIPVNKSSASKRKRIDSSVTIKHMIKDESLGLFHGLGRVLNPKRLETGNSWRLNCDIGKLVDEFSIQPSKFHSFLCENYIRYFGDLKDISNAAEVLSFTSTLMENWDNHEVMVEALWISVLGVMVFNEHKVSKWNQIRGPKKIVKTVEVQFSDDEFSHRIHPTERCYYNALTKSDNYSTKFNWNI